MISKKQPNISWAISIPLINNPFIFRASIQLCLVTWIVAMVLFGFIFVVTGEFDALLPMLTIMTMIIVGIMGIHTTCYDHFFRESYADALYN